MNNFISPSITVCASRKNPAQNTVIFRNAQVLVQVFLLAILLVAAHPADAQSVWNATNNISANTNWSAAANWTPATVPGTSSNVTFTTFTAVTNSPFNSVGDGPDGVSNPTNFNNVVDINFTNLSLTYTNLNSTFQNTLIASGVMLNVNSNLTVGYGPSGVDPGGNPGDIQFVTIAGTGATLNVGNTNVVSNTNTTVWVAQIHNASAPGAATLDLSGLDTFNANVGKLLVAVPGGSIVYATGTIYLAATNNVSASFQTAATETSTGSGVGAIIVGDGGNGAVDPSYLYLGHVNTINADTIITGRNKQPKSLIQFNPNFQNVSGTSATFRGFSTNRVLIWSIGDGGANTGTLVNNGTNDFSGGNVNALVGTMYVGRGSSATGNGVSSGTLTLDTGVINVNALFAGYQQGTSTTKYGVGTVNVNSNATLGVAATLIVNNNFSLGVAGGASSSASGTLNINGGTVMASNIVAGIGTSAININGGTLVVTNAMGTAAAPLTTMIISNSTMTLQVVQGVTNVEVNTLTINGTTDTINIASLPITALFPTSYPLIAYSPGNLSGTFDFNLGTLPGTYHGYLSNDTANSSVDLVITNSSIKTDVWNGNVNSNWDTSTLNWLYSGSPVNFQQGDFVRFDDTLTGTTNVTLTTTLSPGNVEVSNTSSNYAFTGIGQLSGATSLIKDGTGSLTLAETGGDNFSGGITVNNGTIILDNTNSAISGGLTINGGTAQIGNNDGSGALPSGTVTDNAALVFSRTNSIIVATAISGTGSLMQNGNGTLNLSNTNGYTGNTIVLKGTLALAGTGVISNSAQVIVSNATLDVSGVVGATMLNNLNLTNSSLNVGVPYLQAAVNVTSLAMGGPGNTINVASLPSIPSYPTTVTLLQSSSTINGYNFALGSLPTASPAYAGSIAESGDQTAVLLTLTSGPIGVRPQAYWTGANAGVDTNWSDGLNWQTPGAPNSGSDNVIFTDVAAQNSSALTSAGSGVLNGSYINNVVNNNFTVATLTYTNFNNDYQNTLIADGITLNVTNSSISNTGILTVGSSSADFGTSAGEFVTIAGANGALNVNNTNAILFVGLESSVVGAQQATLDMSALGTFNATVNSFGVGGLATATPILTGTVYLAQTNTIIAVGGSPNEGGQSETLSLLVGESAKQASGVSYLFLGQKNVLNVNSLGVGIAKQPGQMQFNSALIGLNPSAVFRGGDGVSPVSVWSVGDGLGQSGTTTAPTGTADFTGGNVNALVTTMYVGRSPNASGGRTSTGTLTFEAGTVNVNTLIAGYQAFSDTDSGAGTINVNGTGTLVVNNALTLALTTGGSGAASTTGTLNISGTVQANSIAAGINNGSTVNLYGGTLVITNTAGTPAAPLTSLNLNGGTLQLNVNGNSNVTNIVAVSVTTSATTTINIDSVVNVSSTVNIPLISYTGTDPYSALTLGTYPAVPGYTVSLYDDETNSSVDLSLVSSAKPTPRITSVSLSGTTLNINATNGAFGGQYVLLGTTNVALPLNQWTPILTNIFDGSGNLNLSTNIINPTVPQEFYIISQ